MWRFCLYNAIITPFLLRSVYMYSFQLLAMEVKAIHVLLKLQSHYHNRRSPDGRWAKNRKIGQRRPIIGRRWHRFWQILGRPTTSLSKQPSLKCRWPIRRSLGILVIGEASGNGRLLIGRQSADILKIFHHVIGRRSPIYQTSICKQSPGGRSMTSYQRAVGRQTTDIGRHSADDHRLSADYKLWFVLYIS